jgi:hypothetical protein
VDDDAQQETERIDKVVTFATGDLLARIETLLLRLLELNYTTWMTIG